jgi:hypothetical protein
VYEKPVEKTDNYRKKVYEKLGSTRRRMRKIMQRNMKECEDYLLDEKKERYLTRSRKMTDDEEGEGSRKEETPI